MKIHIGCITKVTERDSDFYINYETQNPHRHVGFGVRKNEVSRLVAVARAEGKAIEVIMNDNRRVMAVKIENIPVVQRNVAQARSRKRSFFKGLLLSFSGFAGLRA